MSPPPPTKQQTANKLRALVSDLADIAVDIEYFGGLDPLHHRHSRQLMGFAGIIKEWIINYDHAEKTRFGDIMSEYTCPHDVHYSSFCKLCDQAQKQAAQDAKDLAIAEKLRLASLESIVSQLAALAQEKQKQKQESANTMLPSELTCWQVNLEKAALKMMGVNHVS